MKENSGPQLRAWVQIPFLTTDFTPFFMYLVNRKESMQLFGFQVK